MFISRTPFFLSYIIFGHFQVACIVTSIEIRKVSNAVGNKKGFGRK
jgi:hypothetical protein